MSLTQPTEYPDDSYCVFIRDANLGLRAVARQMVGPVNYNIEQRGGYNDFQLQMNCLTTDLTAILPGDRVEVWSEGKRQYRGWVTDRDRGHADPTQLILKGYGRLFNVGKRMGDAPFVYPEGIDMADLFEVIANRYVIPLYAAGQNIVLEVPGSPTGYTLTTYDARGSTIQNVFNDIADTTENTYTWGFDVTEDGHDRLYLRAVGGAFDSNPGVVVVPVPGPDVETGTGQLNTNDIVNRLRLTIGTVEYPNLLTNGNFEDPVLPGEGTANLLLNGSFEIGTSTGIPPVTAPPTDSGTTVWSWSLTGGASVKKSGDPAKPSAYDGDWEIETDHDTEFFSQTVSTGIIPGHAYTCVWYVAPDPYLGDGLFANGSVHLVWTVTGGTTEVIPVSLDQAGLPYTGTGADFSTGNSTWLQFSATWIAPATATAVEVIGGYVDTDAPLVWDKFDLYDAYEAQQSGWQISGNGTAVATANFTDTADAYEGAYCVSVDVTTAADNDSNDMLLQLTKRIDIEPGATYYLTGVHQAMGVGATAIGWAEVIYYNSAGQIVTEEYLFGEVTINTGDQRQDISGDVSSWTATGGPIAFVTTAPQSAVSAMIQFRFRNAATWLFDMLCFQDVRGTTLGFVPGLPGAPPYLPPGAVTMLLLAENYVSEGTDADVFNSYTDWGWREATDTATDITTLAEVTAFAVPYFLTHAKAIQMPTVTLLGARRGAWTSENLSLQGTIGAAISSGQIVPVQRIRGQIGADGVLRRVIESGAAQPTLASLIRQAVAQGTAFAVASSYNAGSGGTYSSTAPPSVTVSLAPTGVDAGIYGDTSNVGQFTLGADGRITAAENVAIVLADTGVTAGIYGDDSHVPQFTVGADGRVTLVTEVAISGGGGGGGSITPSGLSGLLAWYDASQITGHVDGDAMTTWPDMSGNGNDATASGALEPTYKTGIVNSLPVMRFGGSEYMTSSFTPSGKLTVFMVANFSTGAPFGCAKIANPDGGIVVANNAGFWLVQTGLGTGNWCTGASTSNTTAFEATWNVMEIVVGHGSIQAVAQGAPLLLDFAHGAVATGETLTIGAFYNRAASAFQDLLTGDIAELIIYSRDLTPGERAAISLYLATKYGI